jgi:D-serine dehydratase
MSSDAGAWGLTVATISQARVWRAVGAERIVLANELVEPGSARWVAGELNRDADFEVFCLVDSVAGVAILDASLEQAGLVRPLKVFIEVGFQGGRTGCRSAGEARSVAGAVAGSRNLALAGVESFEGIIDKASPKRPSGRWTICSPKCGAVVAGLDAAGCPTPSRFRMRWRCGAQCSGCRSEGSRCSASASGTSRTTSVCRRPGW